MLTRLDHVLVESDDFADCCRRYERLVGRPPRACGDRAGSALRVFTFENGALAIGDSAARGGRSEGARAARLAALAFATPDLAAARAALAERGLPSSEPYESAWSTDAETWPRRACSLDAVSTRGVAISLIQCGAPDARRHASGGDETLSAVDHVVVRTADVAAGRALYGEALGLRLALERESHGGRMLFYRIAGVTLELVEDRAASGGDVLHGLAYRTRDIAAAHARLTSEEFALSELREGRKPGTCVFTVRGGTCDIPTLILSDPSRS